MNAKDLFSQHAADYSIYRPDYPPELFEFIFSHVNNFEWAWDCGTGNGQAAKILAGKFSSVFATDISEKQLVNAKPESNIFYSVSPAEMTSFPPDRFDLVTVAQAVHWFHFGEFYNEVRRVSKANSIIAVWGYGVLSINQDFDKALNTFYKEVVGPYWDPERKYIDEYYKSIPFPFREITAPQFHFTKYWTSEQLAGYLSTWSAVQKFIKARAYNPVPEFMRTVKASIGDGLLKIRFPLFTRIGFVE